MKKWSLNAKVYFIIAVMTLGICAVSVIGIIQMGHINSILETITKVRVQNLIRTHKIMSDKSAEELSQSVTEQAASLEETASSIEEMSSMVQKNADNRSRANVSFINEISTNVIPAFKASKKKVMAKPVRTGLIKNKMTTLEKSPVHATAPVKKVSGESSFPSGPDPRFEEV